MSASFSPQAPLFIVLNAASGKGDAEGARAAIEKVLRDSGRHHEISVPRSSSEISTVIRKAVERACRDGGAVVAAGGDGTINAVAQASHEAGCPMGLLPRGTFNYVSRTHGIPPDTTDAALALLSAQIRPVQVGMVNNRVFLVNASLGLYPQLLEDREHFQARFGRHRGVSLAAAAITLLREHRQLRLHIELDGASHEVRTPTLFIGNNRLQLERVGIEEAPAVTHGRLAAVMLKPVDTRDMLRLLWHGALGTLGEADQVDTFEFERLAVSFWLPYGLRRVKVAIDGEITWMRSPLEFRVSPKPLYLLKPAAAAAQMAGAPAAA